MVSEYFEAEVQQMLQDDEVFIDRMTELQSLRDALLKQKECNCQLKEQLKRATKIQLKLEATLNQMEQELQQQCQEVSAIRKRMFSKNVEIGLVATHKTTAINDSHKQTRRRQQCRETDDGDIADISYDDEQQPELPESPRLRPTHTRQLDSSPLTKQLRLERKRKSDTSQRNNRGSELHNIEVQTQKRQCNQLNNITRSDVEVDLGVEQNQPLDDLLPHPRTANHVDNSKQSEARPKKLAYQCSECDKRFNCNFCLTRHLRTHARAKPFICTECGVAFSDKSNFTIHQRIHTGEKPFICMECGVAFSQKSNLTVHQRVHSGEKPFKCFICNTAFTVKRSLSAHSLIHASIRPHKCNVCKKTFRLSFELSKHRKVHAEKEE